MPYKTVDLNEVDWHNTSFPIGVVGPYKKPWLQMTRAELIQLHTLLTTRPHVEVASPAEASEALCDLANWAMIAADWIERGEAEERRRNGEEEEWIPPRMT